MQTANQSVSWLTPIQNSMQSSFVLGRSAALRFTCRAANTCNRCLQVRLLDSNNHVSVAYLLVWINKPDWDAPGKVIFNLIWNIWPTIPQTVVCLDTQVFTGYFPVSNDIRLQQVAATDNWRYDSESMKWDFGETNTAQVTFGESGNMFGIVQNVHWWHLKL